MQRYLPIDTIESGIHPIYFCSTHYIEMLLKTEVPLVFSAFQMSGFAPSQVFPYRVAFLKLPDLSVLREYYILIKYIGNTFKLNHFRNYLYFCTFVFKVHFLLRSKI